MERYQRAIQEEQAQVQFRPAPQLIARVYSGNVLTEGLVDRCCERPRIRLLSQRFNTDSARLDSSTLRGSSVFVSGTSSTRPLIVQNLLTDSFIWRPQGGSNPRYRRERAVS
ncbi:hypothetical protein Lferr_1787 [Acidithiobacillus ferrooxidans ATCC 53993]|nr:hypothetical protein Lferr_1787 [Acidithiobacillus ferrooxidans ATCC 53993]